MKKLLLLAAAVALVAAALAVPAIAQGRFVDDGDRFRGDDDFARLEARDDFFDLFADNEDFFDFFNDDFDNFDNFDQQAQVEQGFDQQAESGDIDMSFETSNTGDNSNVCAPALQFGNTGNLQNAQGVVQYGSAADDIGFEGSQMVFAPELATNCEQAVQQSSAASSN